MHLVLHLFQHLHLRNRSNFRTFGIPGLSHPLSRQIHHDDLHVLKVWNCQARLLDQVPYYREIKGNVLAHLTKTLDPHKLLIELSSVHLVWQDFLVHINNE